MEQRLDEIRIIPIHVILGLKDASRRISVRCPFHNDGTPSLVIYPNLGGYHCFGCGANGQNAIDFTMALGYSFTDAVKELTNYL